MTLRRYVTRANVHAQRTARSYRRYHDLKRVVSAPERSSVCQRGEETRGEHPDALNPVMTADVTDALATFVADPFLVREGEQCHLSFEIKDRAGDVFLAHAMSDDGLDYEYNQVIIPPRVAQHTHPYGFRHDEEWFMTPSPGSKIRGQFRIYRATQWELVETPLTERVRVDPTPFQYNGHWCLIFQKTETYDILLYESETLLGGDWTEHPESPVFTPRNREPYA